MDEPDRERANGPEGDEALPAWRQALDPFILFHYEHPVLFWLAAIAVVGLVLGIGSILAPEIFLEWIWTHFWGPTVADANQRGFATRFGLTVSEDYTLTSELVYGLILAGALASLYLHLFKKRGIEVDGAFIASLLPYVLFGPLVRSLEDASVFCQAGTATAGGCTQGAFSYLFISPVIYLVTAAVVVAHLLLAYRTQAADRSTQYKVVGGWLAVQFFAFAAIVYGFTDQFATVLPVLPAPGLGAGLTGAALGLAGNMLVLVLLSMLVYHLARSRGGSHRSWSMVAWGLPFVLAPSALIARWALLEPWLDPSRSPAPRIVPVVLVLTLVVLLVVVGISYLLRRDAPTFGYFLVPLNLGLIAGHMIDGFATFAAICTPGSSICEGAGFLSVGAVGYGEKHPVSEYFLHVADGWGFPLMKLLLVGLIVVLIDRSAEEGDEDPTLIGLVKLAVLVLGLAPGVRDVVRVAMGI